MAIDPKLVSIRQANQLPVSDPSENADFLFYEGEELMRSPMSNIYDKVNNGINGVIQPSSLAAPATGFFRYLAHTAGTYTNFGGIVVSSADLDVVSGVANNRVIIEVNEGAATKHVERVKGDTGPAADPAKLPLYSAIKSANIAAGTQFIDDENGNIQYRVKTGQTLLTTELPANVVGTKVERVGGADTSNLERQKPTNLAVGLKTGTSLLYSDAAVGNLGGNFSISVLMDFVSTVAEPYLIQKGDPTTNGWAIRRRGTGVFFVANGVETLITYNVIDFHSFITIIGDGNKVKVYGNGKLLFEQTGLVTTATEAIKIAPVNNATNADNLYYISINSAAISESDIKDELSKIVGTYSINEIQRDFVGNFVNFTATGAKKGSKQLSGTAVIATKTYPDWTLKEGSLISQKDMGLVKQYVRDTGVITPTTTSSTSGFTTNNEVNVENYGTIRLVNTVNYFSYYYKFLDKDRKIIKIDRVGELTTPALTTVDLSVPPFAVYFVGTFGRNAGIIGLAKRDVSKPILQKRLHKAQQDIELLAPCIYDGTFDLMSSQTPTTLKIFDVLSNTASTMTIATADWDLFPNNGIVMDLAVKSSTGNYYFVPVLKSATTGVLDVYQKTLDFTPVKFMAAHDTTTSAQGQHLSAYGSRALADGIIGSIQNPTSYRNNGSIGFVSNDGVTAFTKINTTDFLLHDDNGQEVFKGSGVATVTSESTNDDALYKGGFALGHVLNIRANVAGEIVSFKTKSPFKNGFFEVIIENPIGTLQNGYIAVATANLVIENNGVEVYNAPIYAQRYQKVSVTNTGWDNITVKIVSNSAANSCVFIKSMILFRAFAGQVYNPFVAETSTSPVSNKSIVAFFSDSWGEYPIAANIIEPGDDTTLLVRAFDGTNGAGYGYTPKRIAAKTGAEVDNWAYGGTTAVGQYKMMWDIMKKKRYTHIVVHFYLNDMTQGMSGRVWENALRAIVRTAIANGIQPIVCSPMASASDGQRRGAGQMAMSIRRGLYEAL